MSRLKIILTCRMLNFHATLKSIAAIQKDVKITRGTTASLATSTCASCAGARRRRTSSWPGTGGARRASSTTSSTRSSGSTRAGWIMKWREPQAWELSVLSRRKVGGASGDISVTMTMVSVRSKDGVRDRSRSETPPPALTSYTVSMALRRYKA